MRVKKSSFKTFLGVCAVGLFTVGVCQEVVLRKENKYTSVVHEDANKEDTISYEELIKYEIVDVNDKLYIARANSFNHDDELIYYDIFTNKDIVKDNEENVNVIGSVDEFLYDDDYKDEYTKEDLEKIYKNICESYNASEEKQLVKKN